MNTFLAKNMAFVQDHYFLSVIFQIAEDLISA